MAMRLPPMDPKKKRAVIIGASVVGVLILGLFIKGMTEDPPPIRDELKPLGPRQKTVGSVAALSPEEKIQALLAECRTYSSNDHGNPDWSRAKVACDAVLEIDPIQDEANTLIKRISVLEVCEENMNRGRERNASGNPEGALEAYEKIGKDCESYLLRVLVAAKDPLAEVKRITAGECKSYASNAKWEFALKSCERWSRLWCQTADESQLYAPALMKLKLEGPLNPKTDWRPSEPLYINFLKAKERLKPGEPLWTCPEIPAFRPPPPPPDPANAAREELSKRYQSPELGRALVLYYDGKFPEAPIPLQKIRENVSKAQWHEEARALLQDINQAINLYENGTSEITNNRPDRAEAPFLKALSFDEKLVLGEKSAQLTPEARERELLRRQSFVRRNIVDTMSRTSYEKGKALADRKDFRAACKIWKLGARFSRTNIDLLRALTNVCTQRAADYLQRAQTCEQFNAAMDFAVDGDGFKEQITEALQANNCN